MNTDKKLYIVQREVRANSVAEAAIEKGLIFNISLADDKYQPEAFVKRRVGFRKES